MIMKKLSGLALYENRFGGLQTGRSVVVALFSYPH
ncbi:hypothetical protein SAMN06295970_1573 [Noviherbaspirillum suwonense]|uniref:Uncharacterized protein n=1 Tax=Noviherbaspirillum suwonense TaxID=1224511 RepID=A0ABY1QYB7_9BURK|nr:hypothetical protein SAMN06295970_1573 [Noviherbaspirillum suwonense]